MDLRVDDHGAPVGELERLLGLLGLHELYFGAPEDLQVLEGALAAEVDGLLRGLGHDGDQPLDDRLSAWMGWENYEERHVPGSIDRLVLGKLREAAV